jgi:hypothetical protein
MAMKRIGYTHKTRHFILVFALGFLAWGFPVHLSSVSAAESVKKASMPAGELDFDPVTSQADLFDGETMGLWQPTDFYGKGKIYAKDGAMVLERGNDMTGVTWGGPLVRINYEISLQAQRVEGSDFFCGLTFPVGDEYCSFICGGWGGSLVGLSCVDYYDAANNETSSGYDFVNKRWYSIRVRVTQNMLQAWIDDDQVVDLDIADRKLSVRFEMEPSRPLGIATWQTAAAVRDISIRKVKPQHRYAETYTYIPHEIEGWDILLNEQLDTNHPYLAKDTLRLLKADLYRIGRTLSVAALTKLQRVKIWVEYEDENYACMCYHPDDEWLKKQGYNPDKLNSIEIAGAANFLKWTPDQPGMVLHELAHAYHHQVLGYDNELIKAAFAAAKQGGTYKQVLHVSGETRRHSALNSAQEYFAECTEAFFGTNDFYPFVRAELKLHDPGMYKLMDKLWNPAN